MKGLLNLFKKEIRNEAIAWWNSLTENKKIEYQEDFFSAVESGETTDIDIEVMYRIYKLS